MASVVHTGPAPTIFFKILSSRLSVMDHRKNGGPFGTLFLHDSMHQFIATCLPVHINIFLTLKPVYPIVF